MKCRAKTRGALDLNGVMLRHLKVVERLIKISGGTSRIDWRAAGVAGVAVQVWERLFRLETPNSIHADAPGPFGRFLTDILNELWWEFAPEKTPPSARSAMRAFKNVTNSGMQFRSNW